MEIEHQEEKERKLKAKRPKVKPTRVKQPDKINGGNGSLDHDKELLRVLTAVRRGDFSARMSADQTGIEGKIADALNNIIEMNEMMVRELGRISTVVGKEGKIDQRATLSSAHGS